MKIIQYHLKFRTLLLITIIAFLFLAISYYMSINKTPHIVMNNKNYTTILKDVHNNAYEYSGERISLSGYIFRGNDFNENQFVIARDMMISDNEYRIVGFLCESTKIIPYLANTWVAAEGVITLGDYHGPMPIIQIESIKNIKCPSHATVSPP